MEEVGNTVLGRPVEVLHADCANKADLAASITREWIDQGGVDLIVDGASSGAGLAIQQVTREKERIFIAIGPATSDLTGKACSPFCLHISYDTYALAKGTGEAVTKAGGKTWYFITADYAFGEALQRDTTRFLEAAGGRVVGSVRHPLGTADFSSFLLQAQASKADIIALANAGTDAQNALKQAAEFGVGRGGDQHLAALLIFITDVFAVGLPVAGRPEPDHRVLLGPDGQHPGLHQAVHGLQAETAFDAAGGQLHGGEALAGGGGPRGHDRRQDGDGRDEGRADQRHEQRQCRHPRRWPGPVQHVPNAGEDAGGEQRAVRCL